MPLIANISNRWKLVRRSNQYMPLKYLLPNNVLFMIYNSLVLPHLNYCNHIWGNTLYKSHLSKLYILQKKAVRIITKSHVLSPSAPLFKELQLLSIYQYFDFDVLYQYTNILPDNLSNMFVSNSNINNYLTRHYHQPKFRSTSSLTGHKIVLVDLF